MPLRGVVHDPTARYMGGVAGHAGLFTTADDLARYAQMWLNKGWLPMTAPESEESKYSARLTIQKFTEPGTPPDQPILRALGWDMDSPFSSNRGELFPLGSFGHTGFTGTSCGLTPTTRLRTCSVDECRSSAPGQVPEFSAVARGNAGRGFIWRRCAGSLADQL